ncbi:hypothetical protein WMO40_12955 [Bacillaceae bacterium CLA-AA-H227]|uniref:Uncharacterized protein n=2 Tax=Robertmurraya TaxID=2837507 RepID=A0A4U1CYW3_9BACI|nr:hypothetical protein [Robertmurraya kyonggiensis]TKC15051.1 hypothetical protein FA727_19340 [Robertmurraya kyonggiensis]
MLSAKLHNGGIISSSEYNESTHGTRIYCLDKNCNAPLIYIDAAEEGRVAHFKTSGKGDSKHVANCGFYQRLDLVESISKVKEYQAEVLNKGVKEIVIRLSMSGLDPDKEKNTTEREQSEKTKKEVKLKNENLTPQSISSVKGVVKLLTEYEPDILSSILVNVGGGRKVPISELVVNQEQAHELLWNDNVLQNVGYFVYGKVTKLIKLEKVMYITLEENSVPFTIVIFQKHWKEFTYTEKQLVGKNVLVFGNLRKNEYKDQQKTEMIIKSDRYLQTFQRKPKNIQEDSEPNSHMSSNNKRV